MCLVVFMINRHRLFKIAHSYSGKLQKTSRLGKVTLQEVEAIDGVGSQHAHSVQAHTVITMVLYV